jgi:hypothetical protein
MTEEMQRILIAALSLVARTPGYDTVSADLQALYADGKIRYHDAMEDRGHAGLLGGITLGAEPFGSVLGLAETLVHEHFHLRRQFPLQKTVSFWGGVFTGTNPMRRYEAPAYQAGIDFLMAVARAEPPLRDEAAAEIEAIRLTFEREYGQPL